jgi:hypothetical protein
MSEGLTPSNDTSLGPKGLEVSHKEPSMAYLVEEHVLHRLRLCLQEDLKAIVSQQVVGFKQELHTVKNLQRELREAIDGSHRRLDRQQDSILNLGLVLDRLDWWYRLRRWLGF